MRNRMRTWVRRGAAVAGVLLLAACGSEGTGPDPAVAALVGDWSARKLVLTSVANPSVAPDLIALGAAFRLNVQPSGQYTAILLYAQQSSTEIGTVSISGNTLTLKRTFPEPGTTVGVYTLTGNVMTLEGDSEFDFNLDGTPEPAVARFEMVRS